MSFLVGGHGKKQKPQYTGLQTQTSTNAVCIPILYGRNRVSPNIIWQGDFASHKQTQSTGKGGGGGTTSYTYSGSFELALGYTIQNVVKTWKDKESKSGYTDYGFSLFLGSNPQAPWGYLLTAHPSEALGYSDISLLAVANMDLGDSNTLGQFSFEYEGKFWNTQTGVSDDCDPAPMVQDFLDNAIYGVGFDTSFLDNLLSTGAATTTGDSAFQTYCRAMGFALSPALVSQESGTDIIERWAKLCNTALVSTGYSIKFHPYGPDTLTANGVTYLPDFPVRYSISDDDFSDPGNDQDPLVFSRVNPADAKNALTLVIRNRANEYNDLPVPWVDQGLVDQFGKQPDDDMDAKEVCVPAMAAIMVELIGHRAAYIRNQFEFTLSPAYALLEAMDVITVYDPRFGYVNVLIIDIDEDDNDELKMLAEEYPEGVSSSGSNSAQLPSNTPVNTGVDAPAVNPPIIFEPPSSLVGATPQIWVAVSG